MEKVYNKLVRDRIPQIIRSSGKDCETEVMGDDGYIIALKEKLVEEVQEFIESGSIEEIADVLEVLYSILAFKKVSLDEIEIIRQQKKTERGGFDQKIKLLKVIENQ